MSARRSTGRSGERARSPSAQLGYEIVVVGTSWGGLEALRTLVAGLPPEFEMPLVIVQHRSRDAEPLLARFLQERTRMPVSEIEDKDPIAGGRIYLAPANYHAYVERRHFSLSVDAPVRYSRPSIDVTMESAADVYRNRTVGVILTGANDDGAEGLRRIADAGGMAVVQQPETATAATMPRAALRAVPTARVFQLERIGPFLGSLPVGPALNGRVRSP